MDVPGIDGDVCGGGGCRRKTVCAGSGGGGCRREANNTGSESGGCRREAIVLAMGAVDEGVRL